MGPVWAGVRPACGSAPRGSWYRFARALMVDHREQRAHPRVEASFRVRASSLELGAGVDLSAGGFFVRTLQYFPRNAVLKLAIDLAGARSVDCIGRVAYVRDAVQSKGSGKPSGMGIEILDMSTTDREALLDELRSRADAVRRAIAAPAEVPRADPGPAPAARASTGPLRVVVVDDDERYRELAAEPFRKRGDSVQTTADGLEALSMCLKEPPDVILSDVHMPRMDGWQLLRLVRARPALASVPVVFLTTLDGDAERLRGYQLGVDAYIAKPYKSDELLVRVHQIVRRAKKAETSPAVRTTLRGELEHVAPGALLSFLEMERKTGVLLLIGSHVARVFCREGRVIRAEVEGRARQPSREVLMTLLDWNSGQFEFSPQDVPGADEVRSPATALLLEHAKRRDENDKGSSG